MSSEARGRVGKVFFALVCLGLGGVTSSLATMSCGTVQDVTHDAGPSVGAPDAAPGGPGGTIDAAVAPPDASCPLVTALCCPPVSGVNSLHVGLCSCPVLNSFAVMV